jgi:hypothetical protein
MISDEMLAAEKRARCGDVRRGHNSIRARSESAPDWIWISIIRNNQRSR